MSCNPASEGHWPSGTMTCSSCKIVLQLKEPDSIERQNYKFQISMERGPGRRTKGVYWQAGRQPVPKYSFEGCIFVMAQSFPESGLTVIWKDSGDGI